MINSIGFTTSDFIRLAPQSSAENYDEEESEDSESDDEEWKLGFVDDADPALLQPQYFPSKVGGLPIWCALSLQNIGITFDKLLAIFSTQTPATSI